MNKSIVIPENQINKLVSHYTDLLKSLNERLLPLIAEKEEVEAVLIQLTGNSIVTSNILIEQNKEQTQISFDSLRYNENFNIPKKIKFILNLKRVPLATLEIIDEIKKLEPNSNLRVQDLSTEISRNYAKGLKYYREGENRTKYKYGLLEWKKEEVT